MDGVSCRLCVNWCQGAGMLLCEEVWERERVLAA
jgi:hypothetical protein